MTKKPHILFFGPKYAIDNLPVSETNNFNLELAILDDQEVLGKQLSHADGLVDASMAVKIDDELVSLARNLKIISTATTGSSHIRLGQDNLDKIKVRTLREDKDLLKNLTPAAEHTWALVMLLARDFFEASQHTKDGFWIREQFPSILLKDKTFGVIGFGRIGEWVSRYALAFGMNVIAYDPGITCWPTGVFPVKQLKDIAEQSDFFSLHVHLSEHTQDLLSAEFFDHLKGGNFFINTSRGELVDERALLKALKKGQLGGAGLDVLRNEPNISNDPLIKYSNSHRNLIITPHCGGYSPDAVKLVSNRAIEKVLTFLEARGANES